jgi:hypothetical protein
MAGEPDWKRPPVVRDPALLRSLHKRWRECAMAHLNEEGERCEPILSLHHIHNHPRDDVEANLIMLCGSGTTGHHGAVQHREKWAREALRALLRRSRPDFARYLAEKLGSPEKAAEWIDRVL